MFERFIGRYCFYIGEEVVVKRIVYKGCVVRSLNVVSSVKKNIKRGVEKIGKTSEKNGEPYGFFILGCVFHSVLSMRRNN